MSVVVQLLFSRSSRTLPLLSLISDSTSLARLLQTPHPFRVLLGPGPASPHKHKSTYIPAKFGFSRMLEHTTQLPLRTLNIHVPLVVRISKLYTRRKTYIPSSQSLKSVARIPLRDICSFQAIAACTHVTSGASI
ncbi:hypothetical protein JAAARDRAFT_661669 [Jaapia argillacea MUCL 33604]|uniref:Uncharacterized protein n=1 Tax=Jaapia argillacea MUCL 33604 TaxID=933084 RepID=A0A067PFM2_9AGAM|nr:hypothetical protein JAAARDRAFT_661669 [Jaapia argillacea MUCL 33604]